MFAPVRCCFDVMFLLFASLFALSVHQALQGGTYSRGGLIEGRAYLNPDVLSFTTW